MQQTFFIMITTPYVNWGYAPKPFSMKAQDKQKHIREMPTSKLAAENQSKVIFRNQMIAY